MNPKLLTGLALAGLLAGCAAAPGSRVESVVVQPEEIPPGAQLEALAGGDYPALLDFVEDTLPEASPSFAAEMVLALLEASEAQLAPSAEYIYGPESREIQAAILAALPDQPTQSPHLSVLCSTDKEILLDRMEEGEIKAQLKTWLEAGLCLHNAEGTYFFVVDYPEYLARYGDQVDEATARYLALAAEEVRDPTLIEEYLSVEVETLGQRARGYEQFLGQYPRHPRAGQVRIYFNGALSKLAFPSYFDNLVDGQGQVSPALLALYEELAGQEDCPVLQGLAREMLDFIAAQPGGVVAQGYDLDRLSENASAVAQRAREKADALYGPLEE